MIIDECKYMRDSQFVNSTELKEKYTYIHNPTARYPEDNGRGFI